MYDLNVVCEFWNEEADDRDEIDEDDDEQAADAFIITIDWCEDVDDVDFDSEVAEDVSIMWNFNLIIIVFDVIKFF